MSSTAIYTSHDVVSAGKVLSGVLEEIFSGKSGLFLSSSGDKIHSKLRLQIVHALRRQNHLERKLCEVLMSCAISAERAGPGGFEACVLSVISRMQHVTDAQDKTHNSVKERALASIKNPTKNDLENFVKKFTEQAPDYVKDIFLTAIDMVGFGGKIIVEKTPSNRASVERVCGYTFELSPAIDVVSRFERIKIVIIDGYIESVAEVHRLLETAHVSKTTVLLFVRGAHPDIFSTLKMNYDRGTLCVIPYVVPLDVNTLNTLKDLAIVSGGDVISSNKGELISSIELTDIPVIDACIIHPTKLIIISSSTVAAVNTHVIDIKKRREESHEGVHFMYDARLRTLSPNYVVIRLPDTSDYVISAQALDRTLRGYKCLVERGCFDDNRLTSPTYAGDVQASNFMRFFNSLGGAVINDMIIF